MRYFVVGLTIFLMATSCVPLRKQFLFQDLKKKNVADLHTTDTTLQMQKYTYLLQPGDIISVQFSSLNKTDYSLDRLSTLGEASPLGVQSSLGQGVAVNNGTGFLIDSTGTVQIPVIGKVILKGKTLAEARIILQNLTNKYLDNTVVNVKMMNFYIFTYGDINLQGRIISDKEEITLIEAIILAGGFKEFANRGKVKLIRKLPGNKVLIRYFSLLDQDIITTSSFYLMPNDIIIVEPLRVKNLRMYSLPNISLGVSAASLLLTLVFAFTTLRNLR